MKLLYIKWSHTWKHDFFILKLHLEVQVAQLSKLLKMYLFFKSWKKWPITRNELIGLFINEKLEKEG